VNVFAFLGSLWDRIGNLPSWFVGIVVALLGLGAAAAYFNPAFSWVWLIVALVIIAGCLVLASFAAARLPEDPKAAVQTFGWRTLATMLLAGLGAGIVIAIAAEITSPKDSPAENAELIKALAAALTGAVTASLVKASESIDGPTASAVESAFKAAYKGKFTDSENGHKAVYLDAVGGVSGWGQPARAKRAELVAAAWAAKYPSGGGGSST
jgi:hypothetical protein